MPSLVDLPDDPAEASVELARRGVRVFPCNPDSNSPKHKAPLTSNGLKDATNVERIVRGRLWSQPGALIGIPTGSASGFVVVDIDVPGPKHKEDGFATLDKLADAGFRLPRGALQVRTSGGGLHVYFRCPAEGVGNSAGKFPGIDVRGDGGYVIAAPSVNADGTCWGIETGQGYDAEPGDELPEWFLAALTDEEHEARRLFERASPPHEAPEPSPGNTSEPSGDERTERARGVLDKLARELGYQPQGGRNDVLNRAAFTMGGLIAAGASIAREEVEHRLRAACAQNGLLAQEGESKFMGTFKSGFESGLKRPMHEQSEPPARDGGAAGASTPGKGFPFKWFDDIEDNQTKEWVVGKVFGAGEFSCVVGKPGSGKSVIIGDIAYHVAAGREWCGRKVKRGLVVYVAAERAKLTERRMLALRKRHKTEERIPLAVIDGRPDLTGSPDAKVIIDQIKDMSAHCGHEPVWIIVDTLSRAFGGGDQNQSKDMNRFVQSCLDIAKGTGAHVTAIHHSTWNEDRGKGAIDLDGAVDASFVVSKTAEIYRLRCDGANDGEEGLVTAFTMESEEIGLDNEGNVTTAPVAVSIKTETVEIEAADGSRVNFGSPKKPKALRVFELALAEAGEVNPHNGRRAVSERALRERIRREYGGPNVTEESLKVAVRRVLRELTSKHHAEKIGEYFYVPASTDLVMDVKAIKLVLTPAIFARIGRSSMRLIERLNAAAEGLEHPDSGTVH